jgi:hypothetical protein
MFLWLVPQAQPAPVSALDDDRHRQVVHQFTGVARVRLQQNGLLMTATTDAGAIIKFAFGAVIHCIDGCIAGQRLAEHLIVRWHIALLRAGNGKYQPFMALEQRLLNGR